MIEREATAVLTELATSFPIVTLTGPRQSGKTTLSKAVFPDKPYVTLEDIDQRDYARSDPRGFLTQYTDGAVIDEIQHCPDLFSYLQGIVDEAKRPGMYVLTGSQQFGLMSGISQSLAGRAGLVELLPFSINELEPSQLDLTRLLADGCYPPLYDREIRPSLWFEDYVRTYIERDVRQLIHIKDLSVFQTFLGLCAARNGCLINYNELGTAAGIDVRTVKNWLSVLEASYILFTLRPHHKNFSKKLIKSPKLYFYDCGLLAYLLRLRENEIAMSPHKGSLFESLIISEFVKYKNNYRAGLNLYFWRDNKGVEIDLLLEIADTLHPIELKSGKTIQPRYFDNLKRYHSYAGNQIGSAQVIYGGDIEQSRQNAHVVPWKKSTKSTRKLLS